MTRRIPHQSDLVEIEATILIETAMAYQIECDGKKAWLPKSQVEYNGVFTMPEWLAKDKKLI